MTGNIVCATNAAGTAKVLVPYHPAVSVCTDPERELEKLEQGIKRLQGMLSESLKNLDAESAEIVEADLMLLADETYLGQVRFFITEQRINAAGAAYTAGKQISEMLASHSDALIQARSEDMQGISEKLARVLDGVELVDDITENTILVADFLSPQDLFQTDLGKVSGFITMTGSPISHTAIIAGNLGIPYVYHVDISEIHDGDHIVIRSTGEVIVNPEEDLFRRVLVLMEEEKQNRINCVHSMKTTTRICVNIDGTSDFSILKRPDIDGVGLFRTETLLMNRDVVPTEEQQYQVYKQVITAAEGKEVVIRAFDVGADKRVPCLHFPKEKNPALGYRGVRVLLNHEELLKSQLRAILRASVYGNTAVMFPMISSVDELVFLRRVLCQAEQELTNEGVTYHPVKFGAMIETPAAALIAEELAGYVDFFSIGTNDLTQYTLALDRETAGLENYYIPHHPAIYKQIQMVVTAAEEKGIPVCVCGELVLSTEAVERLVAMKVQTLSVAPGAVQMVREAVSTAERIENEVIVSE